ncbi:PAAR domain-containing protein [Sorangium sp. So ce834]|uniref:PAAR domain-containing protein n=1 Tax=Sorangium sp. So ce834 TaxID=3133321 RepID=UPI003F607946
MPEAARVGDNHTCNMVDPSGTPHAGGPVNPPGSPTVITNSVAQARATDRLTCAVPAPDFIVTGAGSVLVDGLPAARKTDRTMHAPPGQIMIGSPDVLIGGPTVGATLGNPAGGNTTCQAAASGRSSGRTQQSYNNCGVESSRQLINQANGSSVREDALLDEAMRNGDADQERRRFDSGGTSPAQRQSILARNGVPSTLQPNTMDNITQAVAERRGVITSHDVSVLWGPGNSGGHAVVVTGLEYDQNGNLINVVINDTGRSSGNCQNRVPAAQFRNSLRPGRDINVTTNPIW